MKPVRREWQLCKAFSCAPSPAEQDTDRLQEVYGMAKST